jgi:NADH-quinone oxidoreductase subunit L
MTQLFYLLPLIPLVPYLMALVNGVFLGRKAEASGKRPLIHALAIGAVATSCLLSIAAVFALKKTNLEEFKKILPANSRLHVYPEQHRVVYAPFSWIGGGINEATPARDITTLEGREIEKGSDNNTAWGFMLDPLSAVMLLFVTFIGTLIHIFSVRYMDHDEGHYKFFAYLNLFMGSMLMLILGSSLAVLFVGWEGVGLCSYLLIGFYTDRMFDEKTGLTCSDAGRKAFITNRIGDLFFASGMLILLANVGSLNFPALEEWVILHGAAFNGSHHGLLIAIVLLMFAGATAKSAQIPLYVWLPDAMAGPTPVSALIHAATMVTAGIYMLVRMNFLTALTPEALAVVAIVGALTAVFAATMGLVATDIKKVLAYSTVSQLGYMFLGVGVGAAASGLFHVFTHAFFKALMFLGAGAVIYSLHHVQDIRYMGQLRKKLPTIHWTFLAGVIAIAGIAPLSGFWSKDEILWQAFSNHFFAGLRWGGVPLGWVGWAVYGLGIIGACLTPFYMGRLYGLVFHNTDRVGTEPKHHDEHGDDHAAGHDDHGAHKIHEPDGFILWPLRILAIGAIFAGFIGMGFFPKLNFWEHWLTPILETGEKITHHRLEHVAGVKTFGHGFEYGLAALSVAIGLAFLLLAIRVYGKKTDWPEKAATMFPRLYAMLMDKWRVDEFYGKTVIAAFYGLSKLSFAFDKNVVDGAVNFAGKFTLFSSNLAWFNDKVVVDGAGVNGTGWLVRKLSGLNRRWQSGEVQNYAAGFLCGILALLALYYFSLSS